MSGSQQPQQIATVLRDVDEDAGRGLNPFIDVDPRHYPCILPLVTNGNYRLIRSLQGMSVLDLFGRAAPQQCD